MGEGKAAGLPVKVVIAVLLVGFVLMESGFLENTLRIEERHLPLGGILSGFFGGLSGHQGAFRSACLVDLPRLAVYGVSLSLMTAAAYPVLLLAVIGSALAGTVVAARFIKAVTMSAIRALISAMLISIALGLGTGLL